MAKSREGQYQIVDLIPEDDFEKVDPPQYHVEYFKKKYPFTSLLFTRKELAEIVVEQMEADESLAAIQRHNFSSDPTLNSFSNPDMPCDEKSFKKLCAGKKK